MSGTTIASKETQHGGNRIQDVPAEDRTKVIILSQVVAIVALLVIWSIIRSKRAAATTEG